MPSFFIDRNLVRFSPISRYKVKVGDTRIGNVHTNKNRDLFDEIISNPFMGIENKMWKDFVVEIRRMINNPKVTNQSIQPLQEYYRRLRLPIFIKYQLKKFVRYMLRY